MGWVRRRWAQILSVAVHAGLIAVLMAGYEPVPPAPAAVRVEIDLTQPPAPEPVAPEPAAPEPVAEAPPPPEPLPEPPPPEPLPPEPAPVVAELPPPEPPPLPDDPPPPAAEPVIAMVPPPPAKPRPPEPAKRPPPATPIPVPVPRDAPVQPAAVPTPAPVPAAVRPAGPPPDYLALLQARLARHKVYPRAAQLAREEGTVLLRFVVARDGSVLSWRIERSSGFEALDRQVAAMIERAAPLPPMPDSVPGDRLDVALPVQFALR